MRLLISSLILALTATALLASSKPKSASASTMQQKINRIEANGRSPHPSQTPTVLTEQEVNTYLASGDLVMPAGVEAVKLHASPGVIDGTAKIDFDKVRETAHSSNPLLSIFSGLHDVEVATHSYGEHGKGHVHVDSVSLDGVEVPRFVLELFVEKYLTPKYPEIGLDSQFSLPDRIGSAVVGDHTLTIIQK